MTDKSSACAPQPKRSRRFLLKRFRKQEDGATAIEFALIATPFLALLFAIMETALVFWCGQVLETAVSNATRRIFTGQNEADYAAAQAAAPGLPPKDFIKAQICAEVPALFDCDTIELDVRSFKTFDNPGAVPPLAKDGAINSEEFGYQQGGAGDIVLVRAVLPYRVLTSFMAPMATLADGSRMIVATAAFRNEPYAN